MTGGWLEIPGWGDPVSAFISWQETAAIFAVILIVFGPKSIPEVARLLGKFYAQFREAAAELQRNLYLDDIKDIQREMRGSWKSSPDRMRTVRPGAKHEDEEPEPDPEDVYAPAGSKPTPTVETDQSEEAGPGEAESDKAASTETTPEETGGGETRRDPSTQGSEDAGSP